MRNSIKVMALRKFSALVTASALSFCVWAPDAHSADVEKGRILFGSNCEMCHPGGENSLTPQKPLKGASFAAKYPQDAQIMKVIRNGIPKTVMSPFPPQRLTDEQARDIIAFIRTMTPTKSAPKVSKTTVKTTQKCPPATKSPPTKKKV